MGCIIALGVTTLPCRLVLGLVFTTTIAMVVCYIGLQKLADLLHIGGSHHNLTHLAVYNKNVVMIQEQYLT